LTQRFADGDVHIVSGVNFSGKTKEGVQVLAKLEEMLNKKLGSVLFVCTDEMESQNYL